MSTNQLKKIIEVLVEVPIEHHKYVEIEKVIHVPVETIVTRTEVKEEIKVHEVKVTKEVPYEVEKIVYKDVHVCVENYFVQDIEIVKEEHSHTVQGGAFIFSTTKG